MKKILAIVLFIGLCGWLNPETRLHRDAVRYALAEHTGYNVDSFAFDALARATLNKVVYRRNYFVCSITIIRVNGAEIVVGAGALNYVYVDRVIITKILNDV